MTDAALSVPPRATRYELKAIAVGSCLCWACVVTLLTEDSSTNTGPGQVGKGTQGLHPPAVLSWAGWHSGVGSVGGWRSPGQCRSELGTRAEATQQTRQAQQGQLPPAHGLRPFPEKRGRRAFPGHQANVDADLAVRAGRAQLRKDGACRSPVGRGLIAGTTVALTLRPHSSVSPCMSLVPRV